MVANLIYMVAFLTGHVVICIAALFNFPNILFPIVFFLRLFAGPIFPTTIVAVVNILPVHYHASGIGYICAFAGGGGAAALFLIGLVANSSHRGLLFYLMIVAILFLILTVAWVGLMLSIRKAKKKAEREESF